MPKAPPDYQTRYPIDFAEIDPTVRQTVVQLYAADGAKSRGLLYMPPKSKPRTVVIMAHPRGDFAQHYSIPFSVEAGFAAFAQNTRYLNNDSMMLHENLLIDLAAGMRYLREEQGFERIVRCWETRAVARSFRTMMPKRDCPRGHESRRRRVAVRPT